MRSILDTLNQDLRHALRALGRAPGFTGAAILTLAIGIGLTTAVFSLVNSILLRPLPYADGDQLVLVRETLRGIGNASVGHFRDWSEQSAVLEETAAIQGFNYNLAETGEPERVRGMRVTPGYFRAAFIQPVIGRYFADDDARAARSLVVLSELLWRVRFDSDPDIVGKTIRLSDAAFTVVGVAPAAYALTDPARVGAIGGFSAQLWTLLTFSPEQLANYGAHSYLVLGKLRPGVSLTAAQTDLERVTRDISRRNPENTAGRGVLVQPLERVLTGDVRTPLLLLLAAVSFVLIVGSFNLAGLLLARATARQKEIAIRSALGGGIPRIVRQLLTESMVLAVVGGALGLLVGVAVIQFFVTQGPAEVPRLADAGLQPTVLLFAAGIALMAALVSGLAPALRATRASLQSVLHTATGHAGGVPRDRLRTVMVVAQIGLTAVLLVATGLLVRSAWNLQQVPLGFNPENVLTARIALPAERYETPDVVASTYGQLLEQIRTVQGVSYASASTKIPLDGGDVDARIAVEGRTFAAGEEPSPNVRLVADDYFAVVGMSVVQGRPIQSLDTRPGAAPVVVINERLADMLWPGESPIGKRISGWTVGQEPEWRQIVGVVADVRTFGRDEPVQPEMFFAYTQAPAGAWDVFQRSMTLVVRTEIAPETYGAAVRQAVATVDPTVPLFNIRTLDTIALASVASPRFYTRLITLLAVTGLALAALGLYAVIAYFVAQRRPEIGVRVALGAARHTVVGMVLRQGLGTALVGSAIGLGAAYLVTPPMKELLFEVEPSDPQTFAAVAVILVLTTLLACWIPARRAANLDPIKALRAE